MTDFTLANPTAGGATPTINLAGQVSWTPNTVDAQTRYLTLTITQQTGTPQVNQMPVSVVTKELVFTATLVADQELYASDNGAYIVKAQSTNG